MASSITGTKHTRHRRSSSGLGLLAPPAEPTIIDALTRELRAAASLGVMDALASAAQRVADYLHQQLTEETPLAALEAASAMMNEALHLFNIATLAVTTQDANEACLAGLTLLIPLIHSPATNPATKVLQVDSCLNCALRLCATSMHAAVFARTLDALLEVEASQTSTMAARELIAKATEPLAEYAINMFEDAHHSAVHNSPFATATAVVKPVTDANEMDSNTAALLVGIKALKVAVHRAPNLIDSATYALAWCCAVLDHPHASVRDAASDLLKPLLVLAQTRDKPQRLADVAAVACYQLRCVAAAIQGHEVTPTAEDTAAAKSGAGILFNSMPASTAAWTAIAVIEAIAVMRGVLTGTQIEACLIQLTSIAQHLLVRRVHQQHAPAVGGPSASHNPLADERVVVVLRSIVALRRSDGARFVKSMSANNVGAQLLSSIRAALEASPGDDSPRYRAACPRQVDSRRLFFSVLSYLAETKCQIEGRVAPIVELSPLVLTDLDCWLSEYKVDTSTVAASGGVAEQLLPDAALVPEPACCRLASSFAFLCADEPGASETLSSVASKFASTQIVLCRLRGKVSVTAPPAVAVASSAQAGSNSSPAVVAHQGSAKRASATAASKTGGATVNEVLAVMSKASGFARDAVAKTLSAGLTTAVVAAAASSTPNAATVAAVSGAVLAAATTSTPAFAVDRTICEAVLESITSWYERCCDLTCAGGDIQLAIRWGLHVAFAHAGVFCCRWLEEGEKESVRRAARQHQFTTSASSQQQFAVRPSSGDPMQPLSGSSQRIVDRFVETALRFASLGDFCNNTNSNSDSNDTPGSLAEPTAVQRPHPADIVATFREVASSTTPSSTADRSLRATAPYTYMFAPDNLPVATPLRKPVSLLIGTTRPSALQCLASIAANHPIYAPLYRFANGMTAKMLFVDERRGPSDSDNSNSTTASNHAGTDAVVLLCRAAALSPAAMKPILRRVLLDAIVALTSCAPEHNGNGGSYGPTSALTVGGRGASIAYSRYTPRLRRRFAERTLLDLLREAPPDFVTPYCAGILHAVAAAARIVTVAGAPQKPGLPVDLTHASIALIAYSASASPHFAETSTVVLNASIRSVFSVAVKDPAPLTLLHCSVALAAIVRVVHLPPADGHAVIEFCLSKLRRLGTTGADVTLRKSLLRLAGAVGAGLVPPPAQRVGKKSKSVLQTPAAKPPSIAATAAGVGGHLSINRGRAKNVPAIAGGRGKEIDDAEAVSVTPSELAGEDIQSPYSLNCPLATEDAKTWVGRVVVSTLRDLVRQHTTDAPANQTRFALRALCDVVFATPKHLVVNAPSVPALIDDVIECLSGACTRLSKDQLDADTPNVVQIAELCVSLLALVMHFAPWIRGRAPDVIAAFGAAEAVSRGALHLALARGWIIMSVVAPVDVVPYVTQVVGAQTRVLSLALPAPSSVAAAAAFAQDKAHREAAFEVLEAIADIPNAAQASFVAIRLLCQLAAVGTAAAPGAPLTPSLSALSKSTDLATDTVLAALQIRAVVSAVRAVLGAASQTTEIAAVIPHMVHLLAQIASRGDGLHAPPVSRYVSTHPSVSALLQTEAVAQQPSSPDGWRPIAKMDALAFIANVLVAQLCSQRVMQVHPNAVSIAAILPRSLVERANWLASHCGTLGSWPVDPAFEPPTLQQPTNSSSKTHVAVRTTIGKMRYDKAVRSSSSRGDGDANPPAWDPEGLAITDENSVDAVPRMARIMAPHSLYDEVVACADVVELSHDVARALFHVIALPYLTDHRTENVRPIFHRNAICLSRGSGLAPQHDARLILHALIFAEHDTLATRALTLAASRPITGSTAPQPAHLIAMAGHSVTRLVTPKMPLCWASAPLSQLCEAALKVGDTAAAAVLSEAAVFAALQQLRGDDRVSWMIRNGRLRVIPRPAGSTTLPQTPAAAAASRRASGSGFGSPVPSPTPEAINAALCKLNEACTMLLRVTTYDSAQGASHGLVDSLSELIVDASNGDSTLAVPPSVFQALDLHQRAIDAYDAIGYFNGMRSAAGKAKSLMATGQLQECVRVCKAALQSAPSPTQSPTHLVGSSASTSAFPPMTIDAAEDDGLSDQSPTSARDMLCDYAAFAEWSLGEWGELQQVLTAWPGDAAVSASSTGSPPAVTTMSNTALRRRKYYEAVLALSRRDITKATTILHECWALVASAPAGFGTNTGASMSALVSAAAELQHLAELEEVAVVAEEPSLQPIFQAHWLRRLDAMTAAPSIRSGLTQQWQRSLAVVSLALPVALHAEPFLKLVGVARKQNEVALAATTMRRILVQGIGPHPELHTADHLSTAAIDPRVLLTVAKCHVEFTGDAALAAWAVLRFLQQRAAQSNSNHVQPLDGKTLSKCFRKLAKWEERTCGVSAVRDPLSRIAISSHEFHAISLNPDYAKPWKRWAVHNLKVAKLLFPAALFAPMPFGTEDSYRSELIVCAAHVHCALRGFVTVLELEGPETKVENILNVCNILFDYGGICSVSRALNSLPYRVPVACWSSVVSQVVARALDPRPRVRRVIHDILLRLGSSMPHDVVIPLLATRQSCQTQYVESRNDAARASALADQAAIEHLLNGLRAAPGGDDIVTQASRFVAGLNYTAVLTLEQFHHALTQAFNTYRGSADAKTLVESLEALVHSWNAPVVPLELSGVATTELPIVRPLACFNTDRHTRHCKERFETLINGSGAGTCTGAMGKYRMWLRDQARQRAQRPSVTDQRGEIIVALQAKLNEVAKTSNGAGMNPASAANDTLEIQALQQRLAIVDEEIQKERREAQTRLQAAADPFRRWAQGLADEYLAKVHSIDVREVHPQLVTAKHLRLRMPGAPNGDASTILLIEPRFTVMKSVHRPKQFRIVSSNGRRSLYLLKGREDQRQDERVMQLFRFVNDYLSKADSRGLTLLRFSVIPLSGSTGLIQWVAEAPTFGTILREHRGGVLDSTLVHAERAVLNDVMASYADYDRLTAVQKLDVFTTLTETTDCSDFRTWMRLGARTTEAYVTNRRSYVDSIATTSMVGYVLGLGDRHPNNFLVRQSDCRVVHIDFGDSFEVAQLRSRIPETVPFRLTRQLTCALDLSGTRGAFRATAELVMRTMRRHRAGVLALLDSFVHDPSLDWRSKTDRRSAEGAVTSGTDSTAYRRARAAMKRVELKLTGMEGPVTLDAPKHAAALHARLYGVTHHRSLHPRLCDCSAAIACVDPPPESPGVATHHSSNSPGTLVSGVATAPRPDQSPSSASHGQANFSFASSQLEDELSPNSAAAAIQGWWRQQLHRRMVEKIPDLRFKPSSYNFEQSIHRTVANLDQNRSEGLALLSLQERARVPVYELWLDTEHEVQVDSEASSLDGGHVTPPTVDDPGTSPIGGGLAAEAPGLVAAVRPLSEAAQVRRVTEIAVNEVNLSRLYSGWFPWW